MIYTDGSNPCWIRVRDYGGRFRASTNSEQAYIQIDASLSFRRNETDAQTDLDELAAELDWEEVKCDTD